MPESKSAFWHSRLPSCGGFLLEVEYIPTESAELFLKIRCRRRSVPIGQYQRDIRPVPGPQCVDDRWKNDFVFQSDMLPLAVDEVADNPVDTLAEEILIIEDVIEDLGDAMQSLRTFAMLGPQVGD